MEKSSLPSFKQKQLLKSFNQEKKKRKKEKRKKALWRDGKGNERRKSHGNLLSRHQGVLKMM
jgi:hypothetical protein